MKKEALKDLIYGGISEIIKNKRYYYHSSVGASYSHLTEEGQAALSEYMNFMIYKMHETEQQELDAHAKELVLKELKQ